jgi:hypothetical protein
MVPMRIALARGKRSRFCAARYFRSQSRKMLNNCQFGGFEISRITLIGDAELYREEEQSHDAI